MTLQRAFLAKMEALDSGSLTRPWMAVKSFKLLDTINDLSDYVDHILTDKSSWRQVWKDRDPVPVVALDTETLRLDTRILLQSSHIRIPNDIAGFSLSHDGVTGTYTPITHHNARNVQREKAAKVLQRLVDNCLLVLFHGGFDREVLRLCMRLELPPYPMFEDVQVLQFLLDPKFDAEEDRVDNAGYEALGLKALSLRKFGYEQIPIEDLCKVTIDWFRRQSDKALFTPEQAFELPPDEIVKRSQRTAYAPFCWVPTDMAVRYAGSDAICTWLLWEQMEKEARERFAFVHHIDHHLVDTLTWIERQRMLIDVDRLRRTLVWHRHKLAALSANLRQLALTAGYKEPTGEEFNPDSDAQVRQLLFEIKGYTPKQFTEKGGVASVNKVVIAELTEEHPDDEWLRVYKKYNNLCNSHPENIRYADEDGTVRIFLNGTRVSGGRLSAKGGKGYEVDGGAKFPPQGLKKAKGAWWVRGDLLIPDEVTPDTIEQRDEADLDPSTLRKGSRAKGIIHNHIAHYQGYAICLSRGCRTCADRYGILRRDATLDANEGVPIRPLFVAPPGWSRVTIDWKNIELREAANLSGEDVWIKAFAEGLDLHALAARNMFPEFDSLDKQSQEDLRGVAKILNFQIFYGGTEYTVYQNVVKVKPNITMQECKEIRERHLDGVPMYKMWAENRAKIAKKELKSDTLTGRVVNFRTIMEQEHICFPTEDERRKTDTYYKLRRRANELTPLGPDGNPLPVEEAAKEMAARLREQADSLYSEPSTGVRNCIDYNRFIKAIQRKARNIPVQGFVGDLMRMALNRIRQWVDKFPEISSVMRCVLTVHDETDFDVKDEYLPYIVPRIGLLMRLLEFHRRMKFPVMAECDYEYGSSLQVEHNVEDDMWFGIAALQDYLPEEFGLDSFKRLLAAPTVQAVAWMRKNLHPKCANFIDAFEKDDQKSNRRKALIQIAQAHEFWTIEGMDSVLSTDTLTQWEERNGISARGDMPAVPFDGAIPADADVTYLSAPLLYPEVKLPDSEAERRPLLPLMQLLERGSDGKASLAGPHRFVLLMGDVAKTVSSYLTPWEFSAKVQETLAAAAAATVGS